MTVLGLCAMWHHINLKSRDQGKAITSAVEPDPGFLILRTSTKYHVPIPTDEAAQFPAIKDLLEWCKDQKFEVVIHANGFDNGGDSTSYPCLEICDDWRS